MGHKISTYNDAQTRAPTIYAPNALQEEQQRLLRETFIDLLREELK